VLCLCSIHNHHQHNKLCTLIAILEFHLLFENAFEGCQFKRPSLCTFQCESKSSVEAPRFKCGYSGGNLTNAALSTHGVEQHTSYLMT
jgi:hypothetical protein